MKVPFKVSKLGNEQMGKLDGRMALITGAVVALDSRQPRHLFKRELMFLLLVGVKQNSIEPNNRAAKMRPPFSALPISAIEARRQK
jgi:hypothetical protein